MGTRADWYVGRGQDAEWLGSIAYDGHPDNYRDRFAEIRSESEYRGAVRELLQSRPHATQPEQGWPWPWSDSSTTDYAYAFDGDSVWAISFGYHWWQLSDEEPGIDREQGKQGRFPDMTSVRAVAWDRRSGLTLLRPLW